jgi:4-amino-4-deoxy-L-arabinose transferase-like glycosyltransferase
MEPPSPAGRPERRSTPAAAPSWGRDLALLGLALTLYLFPLLGARALWSPDEGRYAEIPREMVASGDWVTPRLDGVKYFEKPALFYWLQAIAIEIFGVREWALRLWVALFALAGCLAVYAAGRHLFGRRAGLLAAAVLATSPLYYFLSQSITLDMTVSVLLTGTLLAALLGLEAPPGGRRRLLLYAAYASAALATLTKGLIGFLLPGLVVLVWVALARRWRRLLPLHLPSGLALFLAIALPWHLLVARANPDFLSFYFVHEHLLRYATKVHARYQPFWFFVPVLLAGMVPWTAFLPRALKLERDDPRRPEVLFLLFWAGLVLAFFSASSSKLIPYILPCVPPLALLVGRALAAAWEEGRVSRGALASLLTAGAGLAIALAAVPRALAGRPEVAHVAGLLGGGLYAVAIALAAAGLAPFLLARAGRPRAAILALVAGAAVVLSTLAAVAPAFDAERSVKGLAEALKPRLRPGDEVAAFRDYPQDLPVYLGRIVTVAGYQGELEVGMHGEDTSAWIVDEPTFWRRWAGPRRMYAIVETFRYDRLIAEGRPMTLLARSGTHALVANAAAGGSPSR